MNICIIGCGLIGGKRAAVIKPPHRIVSVCDTVPGRAQAFCDARGLTDALATESYEEAILCRGGRVDLVIVCTIVKWLAPITRFAVEHGKHVIVEKPAGMTPEELEPIVTMAKQKNLVVKVGFNHRYHPALLKARELLDEHPDKLGPVMFIRGRYGHGGRVGYDREWRADPALSGGGELIDQGVHLIDLSRWFMGDFSKAGGIAETYFWDMPVDDNAFIALQREDGAMAWLQVSCTEWKNMFSFEIYCKYAKLSVDGLGGSYGMERLSYYQMLPEMGPPETVIYEFPRGDNSWELEFREVAEAIEQGKPLTMGSISDAYEALKIVKRVYENRSK